MIILFYFVILTFLPSFILSWECDPHPLSPSSTKMHLISLSSVDPLAVCNDGTAGGYYFSPSPTSKNIFLIHLPGGAQCYDEESCQKRWIESGSYQMSSLGFNQTCYKTGLLDSSESISPLWEANKVMIGYCSSDAYMGDKEKSSQTWGWHMRGQKIVIATIKDLIKNKGLNDNSKILISGGSAGARGTMVLIDLLRDQYLPKKSKVVAFLDSPFYIDIAPYDEKFKGFQYQEQQKNKLYNTENVISKECRESYTNETWKCLYGQYRIPFVKTPYLMVASQYDAYQLILNIGSIPPYSSEREYEYANKFGKLTHNLLEELANKRKMGFSYYSWVCFNHDVSESLDFILTSVESGITQKDALNIYLKSLNFFQEKQKISENNEAYSWIDECDSIFCRTCSNEFFDFFANKLK